MSKITTWLGMLGVGFTVGTGMTVNMVSDQEASANKISIASYNIDGLVQAAPDTVKLTRMAKFWGEYSRIEENSTNTSKTGPTKHSKSKCTTILGTQECATIEVED